MLAGNPVFLHLRVGSNGQLLELIFLFNWLPVLALFILWGVLRWLSHPLARVFLATVYFLLLLTFFFQIDNLYYLELWRGLKHSYFIWVFLASLLTLSYLRFPKSFRSFVLALSPAVVLFPALFLFRTWTSTRVLMPEASATTRGVLATGEGKHLPSIFLLVFDELTLYALLDTDGQIDAARFPHFRQLAQQSHWFRNATANAEHTTGSIPSILTGSFPVAESSPVYHDYPKNLLVLLHPHYDIYAYENSTRFCLPRVFHCASALRGDAAGRLDLVRDILDLYAHRALPGGTNVGIPEHERAWALFRDKRRLTATYLERFEDFVDAVATVRPEEPVFFFFHNGLPHSPYWLSPEGEIAHDTPAEFRPSQAGNRRLVQKVLERYRTQIMHVDRQLGRLLALLKQRGLYEQSLLIVTADHGVSYKVEAPGRWLKEVDGMMVNADQVLTVPLFVKRPFQKEGVASEREVQLIDIVPSLVDAVGLPVAWRHAGRSVFSPPGHARVKVAFDRHGQRHEFDSDLGLAGRAAVLSSHGREGEEPKTGASAPSSQTHSSLLPWTTMHGSR
jgi:hypothetical protein